MLQQFVSDLRAFGLAAAALLLLLFAAAPLRAQSSEASLPTPVFNNDISGRIAPRDVGDPRRTRHFYTFRGTEGDLVVNLETAELIGDVDVFTATTFRPLLKFTLFGDAARLTKSFYLRKDETLVLRVEARAVGDAEGTYRIRFEGSFAPAPAGLAGAPEPVAPTLSATESRGKNVRRVTSTGARIAEPIVAAPPKEEAKEAEPQPAPTPNAERSTGRRSAAAARGRGARPAPARARAGAPVARPGASRPETSGATTADNSTTATESERPAANTSTASTSAASTPSPTSRRRGTTRPPRRSASRESAGASRAEPSTRPDDGGQPEAAAQPTAATATPAATQRLIIVTRDGETLERDMSLVRRVTVENNQVVIVTRDGKVIRRPMASVLKMSIEP
jgi:hypothetical protein